MTTMLAELYDALLAAGAPEGKARAAAEALTNYDDRFNRIDKQFGTLETRLETRFARIEADVLVLKWMMGTALALLLAVAVKLFVHG